MYLMGKKLEQYKLKRRIDGVTMPITRKRVKWGRNWLCVCDSGKKFKYCCMNEINSFAAFDGNANVTELPEDIQRIMDAHKEMKKNG